MLELDKRNNGYRNKVVLTWYSHPAQPGRLMVLWLQTAMESTPFQNNSGRFKTIVIGGAEPTYFTEIIDSKHLSTSNIFAPQWWLLFLHRWMVIPPRNGQKFGKSDRKYWRSTENLALVELKKLPIRKYSQGMKVHLLLGYGIYPVRKILPVEFILQPWSQQSWCSMAQDGASVIASSYMPEELDRVCDNLLWPRQKLIHVPDGPADILSPYYG